MKRAGALVAAVAMVAVAFVVRDATSGDGAGGSGDPGSGLLCPTEFESICTQAASAVQIADTGPTADALIEATDTNALDGEAWIVPTAWAELVLAERAFLDKRPIFEIAGAPLASAPVALAIWADEAEAITGRCGTELGWRCLSEEMETTAGPRITVGAPGVDSAPGLTIAAAQAAGLLGTSDFATNDFDTVDFRALAGRLAAGQATDALGTMRTRGPGALTAAGALRLRDQNLTSNFGTIEIVEPAPPVRADVVALVPAGQGLDGDTRAALTEAFGDAGWDEPAGGPDGLPDGGVLAAIRSLWNER